MYEELNYIKNHIENILLNQNLNHAREWASYLKLHYALSHIDNLIETDYYCNIYGYKATL